MQYTSYQAPSMKPRKKKGKLLLVFIGIILLLVGLYIAYLLISPKLAKKPTKVVEQAVNEKPQADKNTIFIPSVGIQAGIEQGDINILDKGLAWHRIPDQGNPTKGGNMIITGHSFVWGYRPDEVKKKSIFYDLKNSKVGDEVVVNWEGKQYKYKISKLKTVKPNAIEIEDQTSEPQLTIYTCTIGGAADGRVVIIAKPEANT